MAFTFLVLDVVTALATLVAVGFFLRAWRRSGATLHLLLAVGFLLLAVSYTFVASSEFDLAGEADVFDVLRFLGQTSGALVLALAYVASHGGRAASPLHVLGWSAAGTALAAAALLPFVRAPARLPSEHEVATVAHAVQTVSFLACAALSSSAFRRVPRFDRALVPAAFVLWALGKGVWLLLDTGAPRTLLALVYGCRLTAITLLLLAVALPPRSPAHPPLLPGEDAG